MLPPRTDSLKQSSGSDVATDEDSEPYDPAEFLEDGPDECLDEDYERDRRRRPGALTVAVRGQLLVACLKIARAYEQPLRAGAVALAPFSACAQLGRLNVVVSPAQGAWQARVSSGMLGWDKTHLWASGASAQAALQALVKCAQAAAARRKAAK